MRIEEIQLKANRQKKNPKYLENADLAELEAVLLEINRCLSHVALLPVQEAFNPGATKMLREFKLLIEDELSRRDTIPVPISEKLPEQQLPKLKPIQWLGDQKQLAELFIELKRKGWIEGFEYATIKACFTKSHSIQQLLKPSTDPKTFVDTYEEVYTKRYKKQFDGIKSLP